MFVPAWALTILAASTIGVSTWVWLLVSGRNPLPFPDTGSRIFSAASAEGKAAIVALLAQHGVKERFRFDTSNVLRSIMWDGTIINCSSPDTLQKLDGAVASIGLVADDPVRSANAAVAFLTAKGFTARAVLDAEPELPIAFVVTNAMAGTVLNFRKHVIHMPRPTTPREPA